MAFIKGLDNINQCFIGEETIYFVEHNDEMILQSFDWSITTDYIQSWLEDFGLNMTVTGVEFTSPNHPKRGYARIAMAELEDRWGQTQTCNVFCMPNFIFYEDVYRGESERTLYWKEGRIGTLAEATIILIAWFCNEYSENVSLSDITFVKTEDTTYNYYYNFYIYGNRKYAVGFSKSGYDNFSLLIDMWIS